jgi:hypothetical protein
MSSDPPLPRVVSFDEAAVEHDPDVRDIEQVIDGVRWALVEYAPSAGRTKWCDSPHSGYVVDGELQYEFEDGSPECVSPLVRRFGFRPPPRTAGATMAASPRACS